ncbi:uncharacterized protein N0V89_007310 [Didymosphaeria variabile]|uniref:Protein kinase domain-containing protein n=1 Tax=Didymosphaeria variabile TaxID=1932322 RepID=A0A9W8XLA0_9PLEO|nr:uncharacterized protein N0V89_007310 [Didymosphaeria variabile]KAJ4351965.1 hypothetical protein N0V89_007310 [Didymosphaeria variabile]
MGSSLEERQVDENELTPPLNLTTSAEPTLTSPTSPIAQSQFKILEDEEDLVSREYRDDNIIDQSTRRAVNIAPIVVANLDESTYESPLGSSAITKSPKSSPLESELRSALRKYKGEDKHEFLPIDAFDRIIQVENIKKELCRWNKHHDAVTMADSVMGSNLPDQNRDGQTKRKIFAILGLMEKARKIEQFVKLEICDHQLPFKFQKGTSGRFVIEDRYGHGLPLEMFKKQSLCESFRDHQWEVLAPSFELSLDSTQKIQHLDFNLYERLPFMESEHMYEGEPELAQGGYAQAPGKETYFAVKRLHRDEEDSRQRGETDNYEARVLKRLNDLEDPHIIRLLGTFSYENHFHMIFPWANGNLQDFWKTYIDDPTARSTGLLAQWLCKQMIGLCNALNNVHNTQRSERRPQDLTLDFDTRTHGRHGDIKPENILWFKKDGHRTDQESLGVLKLADFGLADFHSERSKSDANAKGVTQTYQAPEVDVLRVVSQKYDMWSLGCVLLEFAVWYVDGWEGVDNFSQRRSDETAIGIRMDKFYDVRLEESSTKSTRRAKIKASVAGVRYFLTENPRTSQGCSDFVIDILDLVQDYLLRMTPKKRAHCDSIVEKLTTISRRCVEDPLYCTQLRKTVDMTATDHSELSSSETSSERNKDRIQLSLEQNSGEANENDKFEAGRQELPEESHVVPNLPSMGETGSTSARKERKQRLRMWSEAVYKTLCGCLGTKSKEDR